jgi:predicted PurR-regulated permease PerM
MSSTKTVSRNLAIVLAIIIAILLASLIGTIIYYSNLNRSLSSNAGASSQEISTLQSKIAELNQEINSLQSKINQQNQLISSLQSQNAELTQKINNLTNVVNLQEQTTLVYQQTINQPAGSYTYWNFQLQYAGYIVVYVYSSTTTNTYVEVVWNYNGINYDQSITVGASGSAAFPVLPTTVQVRVGNTNIFNGATETASIVYVY